jgi:hypothetical protein
MQAITEQPSHVPYFLKSDYLQGSAYEGTIHTRYGDRMLVLPEELVQGLHRAVAFETGRALPIIMYTCGKRWGARVVKRWEDGWRQAYQERMDGAAFTMVAAWLDSAFRYNGWGGLEIDFSLENEGVVQFFVKDCVFARLLHDSEEPMVGDIFAGLFASLSSWLSGRDLECVQVACEKSGADRSRFVVSTPERVAAVRTMRMEDAGTEQLLVKLMEK